MPGVSTGGGSNAFDARINGGLQSGDEATVDGVSMQQGFMSQGGMVSILQDFPMSPDMVSEIKVLTSGYAPESLGTNFYAVAPYIAMIAILLVRPYGLFGARPVERV